MSTYTAFTREQIEAALPGDGWQQTLVATGQELAFDQTIPETECQFYVRCYTGISRGNMVSRKAGADAIRFVLLDAVSGKPRDKGVRVHRTGTVESLRERFAERVAKLVETAKAEQPYRCKRCGAMTAERRNGKNGRAFRGCVRWKECQLINKGTNDGIYDSQNNESIRADSSHSTSVRGSDEGRNDAENRSGVGNNIEAGRGGNGVPSVDQAGTRDQDGDRGDELGADRGADAQPQVPRQPDVGGGADRDGSGTVPTRPAAEHDTRCPGDAGGGKVGNLAAALASSPKKHPPTAEQRAIIDAARSGVKVLIVQAGAGTGKTSTDVMLSESLGGHGQYTAFNAPLCAEAKGKMPAHVAVNTIHSLAFRAEGYKYKHRLNTGRVKSEETARMLGIGAMEFEGKRLSPGFLAGQVMTAIRRFCNSTDAEVGKQHFVKLDGLDQPDAHTNNDRLRGELLPFARKAWVDLNSTSGLLPFSHDVYAKVWQLNNPVIAADYLLVDEAQDLVPRDLAIIAAQKCQVILVGDDAQTIYAWRGCVNAMSAFPDAPRLLLSQSFRFGPAIAAVANAVLETLDEPTALRLKGLPSIQSRVITKGVDDVRSREQGKREEGSGDISEDREGRGHSGDGVGIHHGVSGLGETKTTELATILCRTNACAVANLLASIAGHTCQECKGVGKIGVGAKSSDGGEDWQKCSSCDGAGRVTKRPFLVGGGADVIKFVEAAQSLKEGRGTSHPELACFGSWGEVEEYAKCFPAGTWIETNNGPVLIEKIAENPNHNWQVLTSRDGGKTLEYSQVTTAYKTPRRCSLVRIKHAKGDFVCTANHPLWVEGRGWTPAGFLIAEDVLSYLWGAEFDRRTGVFESLRGEAMVEQETTSLAYEQTGLVVRRSTVSNLQEANPSGETNLLPTMCGDVAKGSHRSEGRVSAAKEDFQEDEGSSERLLGPYARSPRQNFGNDESERHQVDGSWRQWERFDAARVAAVCISSTTPVQLALEPRLCRVEWKRLLGQKAANELQDRHCFLKAPHRGRDRRQVTRVSKGEGKGLQKGRGTQVSRVDSVEIYEPRSDDGPASNSKKDLRYVYTLTVEAGSYFADGVLAKNCEDGEDLRLMVKLIKEFGCRAILDALRRMPEERDANLIISTAHKSKGREWDHVRLASDFPTKSKCGDPERKLLYVAVTRAKLTLDVSGCPFFTGQDSLNVSNLKGANDEREQGRSVVGKRELPSVDGFADERKPTLQSCGTTVGRGASIELSGSGGAQVAERSGVQEGQNTESRSADSTEAGQDRRTVEQGDQASFTWSKKDGKWLIRGAKGQSGVVTVTRHNGTKSQQRLGKTVEENGYMALYEVASR